MFTLKDAQAVLGNGAKQGSVGQSDISSAQRSVTTCSYSYDPGSMSDLVTATILVRGSSSIEAKQSFETGRPDDAQTISGYGEAAYWTPTLGQLNILKGNYWLILSAGSGPITNRTPDLSRKVAEIIMGRL